MLLITVVTLLFPVIWLHIFIQPFLRGSKPEAHARESLYVLTAVMLPFSVLALSLVASLPQLVNSKGDYSIVATIAGGLILYAVTLVAALVFREIPRLYQSFETLLVSSQSWLRYHHQLSRRPYLPKTPSEAIGGLLEEWSKLYLKQDGEQKSGPRTVLQGIALGTLLSTYAEEERSDISGDLAEDRVPQSVRPPGDIFSGKASFIVTNVGYFANFLQATTRHLLGEVPSDRRLCLAIITSVLPCDWWNWQQPDNLFWAYPPVEKYRNALRDAVKHPNNAKVFRAMLVASRDEVPDPRITSWERYLEQASFCLVKGSDGSWLTTKTAPDLGQKVRLSKIMKETAETISGRDFAYWMLDNVPPEHESKRCFDEFLDIMHGTSKLNTNSQEREGGVSRILEVTLERFRQERAIGNGGFGGCGDMMFIGTCGKMDGWSNVWSSEAVTWSLATMATMSPQMESMFLTVVHDFETIEILWNQIRPIVSGNAKDIP
jgi:hypothetical protein